jgi:ferrous iron transport protein A
MVLTDLHKGESAVIKQIHAPKALRDRFLSFGLVPGEALTVKGCSLVKQTIEIEVGSTLIALRKEEAEKIEVLKNTDRK